jgi:hypothetical protein
MTANHRNVLLHLVLTHLVNKQKESKAVEKLPKPAASATQSIWWREAWSQTKGVRLGCAAAVAYPLGPHGKLGPHKMNGPHGMLHRGVLHSAIPGMAPRFLTPFPIRPPLRLFSSKSSSSYTSSDSIFGL